MAIPDSQSLLLPLLKLHSDGREHAHRESIEAMAVEFKLTEEEKKEMLPSGNMALFDQRVSWAKHRLKKAGLLENPRKGIHKITERGLKELKKNPSEINVKYLKELPEYQQRREAPEGESDTEISDNPPEELMGEAYKRIRAELAEEILERLKECSPGFFERLVVEVIVKMGYGGSIQDAGKAIGGKGDGGVDGVIKEDKLGLDLIYIQAKRWSDTTVGSPEIQKFVGALSGRGANKGIFITTSDFSKEARDYVAGISNFKIVLLDGGTLAQHMIDHDVGVSAAAVYEIKKVDSDYFSEE